MSHNTNTKVVNRYAHIVLEHAIQNNNLKQIYEGVCFLQKHIHSNPSLEKIMANPTISRIEKKKLLEVLYKKHIHVTLWKFIMIILDQSQISKLSKILSAFISNYQDYMGIKSAVLTTAVALPKTLVNQFIQELKKIGNCKKILLKQQVDPSIIGGYILHMDPITLNKSIKHQLNLLEKTFNG